MNSGIFASPLRLAISVALLAVGVFPCATVYAAPPSRMWTDSTGKFKRQGQLLELDGDTVILQTSEGKTLRIPLEKLSKQDREFVESADRNSPDPFQADVTRTDFPNNGREAAPPRSTAPGDGLGDIRTIVVEGVGIDATQAKADAYREAVRQVVGALIDARTMAQNDELVEDKIITLSSAFVEKSEPLKEWQDGSLVRVRILAHVRQSKVLASLTTHHITTTRIDAESLVAQQVTKADQAVGLAEIFKATIPQLRTKSIMAVVDKKPVVGEVSPQGTELKFSVTVKPVLEEYLPLAKKLDAALAATSRPRGEIVSVGNKTATGRDYAEWARDNSEQFLPWIFASEEERARQRSGPKGSVRFKPFTLWDPSAVGANSYNGLGALQDRWETLLKQPQECIVLLMLHSDAAFTRTRWTWNVCSTDEKEILQSVIPKGYLRCSTIFEDVSGQEIARDVLDMAGSCFSATRFNYETTVYAISPFFCYRHNSYVPYFSTDRSVVLTKEEVAAISAATAVISEQ
jgi:hypothetical protein